jgi:WD40 repeat protein
VLVLAAGGIGLTLAASATGTSARNTPKTRHVQGPIESLAIDGSRIAYDVGSTLGKANNTVRVWNVRTGTTTTVSGKHTRTVDDSSTGSGVFQLAIAGTHVAWLANVGGNSEGDDYLFSSR